jgi:hypothetical protein
MTKSLPAVTGGLQSYRDKVYWQIWWYVYLIICFYLAIICIPIKSHQSNQTHSMTWRTSFSCKYSSDFRNMTNSLPAVTGGLQSYRDKVYWHNSFNQMLILRYCKDILDHSNSRSLSTISPVQTSNLGKNCRLERNKLLTNVKINAL